MKTCQDYQCPILATCARYDKDSLLIKIPLSRCSYDEMAGCDYFVRIGEVTNATK